MGAAGRWSSAPVVRVPPSACCNRGMGLNDLLGWSATALCVGSYFCRDSGLLRKIQAASAALWLGYGVMIHAWPVIAANSLVFIVALASLRRLKPDAGAEIG